MTSACNASYLVCQVWAYYWMYHIGTEGMDLLVRQVGAPHSKCTGKVHTNTASSRIQVHPALHQPQHQPQVHRASVHVTLALHTSTWSR